MALQKQQLENDILLVLKNHSTTNNVETVAKQLANAIDKYVKTGNATGTDSRGDTHNLTII